MKTFDLTNTDEKGKLILHLIADKSAYNVTYDYGKLTFTGVATTYIVPNGKGFMAKFADNDRTEDIAKYLMADLRAMYRDIDPDIFSITDITAAAVSSSHFTEEFTVSGVTELTPVVVPEGVTVYINGVAGSSGDTVDNGDTVKFEVTAPSVEGNSTEITISVGDQSKTFTISSVAGYPTEGLLSYINTSNANSYTTGSNIYDLSGNGNNWLLQNGADTTTNVNGTVIRTDDIYENVACFNPTGDFNIGTGDYTISMWIYRTGSNNYLHYFEWDSQDNMAWKGGISGFETYFYGGSEDYRSYNNDFDSICPLNEWVHFVFVRSGNDHIVYTNNVYSGTVTTSTVKSISTSTGIFLGANRTSNQSREYAPMLRGPVAFWNRALNAVEVDSIYNYHNGDFNK